MAKLKFIPALSTMLIFSLFLIRCASLEARKDVDVHIYCQQSKYTKELLLYVNDTFKGNIPFSPEKYTCKDKVPKGITLDLNFIPGEYQLHVATKEGITVSKGILILTDDNMELVGQAGGMDARQSEQCMYIEVL